MNYLNNLVDLNKKKNLIYFLILFIPVCTEQLCIHNFLYILSLWYQMNILYILLLNKIFMLFFSLVFNFFSIYIYDLSKFIFRLNWNHQPFHILTSRNIYLLNYRFLFFFTVFHNKMKWMNVESILCFVGEKKKLLPANTK